MSKAVVDFYYDVVSPWSYIGFEVLLRYQSSWNIDINLRPVFLGGVMQGSGNQPPATLPAKATYGMIDLNRSARYYGLEISMPSVFPTNTITCQRFLVAMQQDGLSFDEVAEVSRLFWKAYWGGKGINIGSIDGIKEALANSSVLSNSQVNHYLEKTTSQEVKDKLKEETQNVLDLGAFGAPWIVVTIPGSNEKEGFFGSDRFHLIAQLLGKSFSGSFPSKL